MPFDGDFEHANRKAHLRFKYHHEISRNRDFYLVLAITLRIRQQAIEKLAQLAFPQSPQADPQYLVVNTSLRTTP
jgi:hypothetical protein